MFRGFRTKYHIILLFGLILYLYVFYYWSPVHKPKAKSKYLYSDLKNSSVKTFIKLAESLFNGTSVYKYSLIDNTGNSNYGKFKLLCVEFMSCSPKGLEQFIVNTNLIHQHCDWAIMCYNKYNDTYDEIIQEYLQSKSIRVVHCKYISRMNVMGSLLKPNIDIPSEYNSIVYPKPLLLLQMVYLIHQYSHVWLLDDDIFFRDFDISRFLSIIQCAYHPNLSPLIWQGLIHENTQSCKQLNSRFWDRYTSNTDCDVIAAETGFVEIQAPLIDSQFLLWFINEAIIPMSLPIHILGADWGYDFMFCKAARYYASEIRKDTKFMNSISNSDIERNEENRYCKPKSSYESFLRGFFKFAGLRDKSSSFASTSHLAQSRGPVCAIVLGGKRVALHHRNSRLIDVSVGRSNKIQLNYALMKMLEKKFPLYYSQQCESSADDVVVSLSSFVKSFERMFKRELK